MTERFTFINPGETLSPDPNNLQRWATQPPSGAIWRNVSVTGSTSTAINTWAKLNIPEASAQFIWNPNQIIDFTNDQLVFPETGIWWVRVTVRFAAGASNAGDYHLCVQNANTGLTANGFEPLFSSFDVPTTTTPVYIFTCGHIVIDQTNLGNGSYKHNIIVLNGAGRDCVPSNIEVFLYSKTLPGKY